MNITCRTSRYSVLFKRDPSRSEWNRTNLSESCFPTESQRGPWWNVTQDVTQGATQDPSPSPSDLERSRAPTAAVTSPTYETDGPLVGDSEKATAEEGSPRIEDSHLPRHPIGPVFSPLSRTPLPRRCPTPSPPPTLLLFVAPRRPAGLLIYLAIYIHVILHRGHDAATTNSRIY